MASFIRQLNMYGFRKISNIENSGLRAERDDIEFSHIHFSKGNESQLEFIKRKVSLKLPIGKTGSAVGLKQEDVSGMLEDVENIKGKQGSMDGLLSTMQRENEALWREIAILRQKHHKQEQVVAKLIQFFVSLVQNRGNLGIKRKAQLMIDDMEDRQLMNKMIKRNEFEENPRSNGPLIRDVTDVDECLLNAKSPQSTTSASLSEFCEPTEHILIPEVNVLNTDSSNEELMAHSSKSIPTLHILDPLQESIKELGLAVDSSEQPIIDETSQVDNLLNSSLTTPLINPSALQNPFESQMKKTDIKPNEIKDLVVSTANDQMITPINANAFNEHIEGIDAELDWLQDQLSSGINIDTSTLLGVRTDLGFGLSDNIWLKQLFSLEDDNSANAYMSANNFPNNQIVGNEVIQFNPNPLFDDIDLDAYTANDDSRDPLLEEPLLPDLSLESEGTVSFPIETKTPLNNHKIVP